MLNYLIFCENCRKKLDELSQLQFVEENSDRGFCSESCILEFYKPYMHEFSELELNLRKKLNIDFNENANSILSDEHYFDQILKKPTTELMCSNELNQDFYLHVLEFSVEDKLYYYLAVLAKYEKEPSFIYFRTIANDIRFVDEFIKAFKAQSLSENQKASLDFQVPSEWVEEVENKKSHFLAEHLVFRKDSDIPFEEFGYFDKYLDETLQSPDEVFQFEDDYGDLIYTSIKSFASQGQTFFYLVLGMKYEDSKSEQVAFLPILGFPTQDQDLYFKYAKGQKISGKLKN